MRTNTYERISTSVNVNRSKNMLPTNILWPPPTKNQVSTTTFNSPSSIMSRNSNSNFLNECQSPVSLSSLAMNPILTHSPFKQSSYLSTDGQLHDGGAGEGREECEYESPYWRPSDQKTELITQISKLKMKFVPNESIK